MAKNSLYFLIIVIFLVGCSGPKAFTKTGKQIPFKTNRIYIITDDKADKAFRKIGSIVQMKGYRIEEATPSLGSIKAFNKLQPGEATATLFIFVRDKNNHTVIQLRGVCGSTVFGTGHPGGGTTINLHGRKDSQMRQCWSSMYSVAKKYDGAKLRFETK